jgi:hypothetical protein
MHILYFFVYIVKYNEDTVSLFVFHYVFVMVTNSSMFSKCFVYGQNFSTP